MFIAALFTIAKLLKHSRYSITDGWIKQMWNLYSMEFYSGTNNEILSFADKWLNWIKPDSEDQKSHILP
jgi:hypothetical protein